jgi:hypothetical protein
LRDFWGREWGEGIDLIKPDQIIEDCIFCNNNNNKNHRRKKTDPRKEE